MSLKAIIPAMLLATVALPAAAQAPPKPPTPLEKAITDLNQSYSGLNGNINALGITANDIRDHQIATVQAAIGTVLAAKTQEDADKLAAQKTADDAALAAAKKAADAKDATLTKTHQIDADAIAALHKEHISDQTALAALQRRVDDQARQLLHVAQPEPPMCINGPMSPKQLSEQFGPPPASVRQQCSVPLTKDQDAWACGGIHVWPPLPHSVPAPGHK